jgi:kinetochore protein Nuf2
MFLCFKFELIFADNLQMADLKENIENEIHSAHDEFLKMDSHIKLYITEMEQSIYA